MDPTAISVPGKHRLSPSNGTNNLSPCLGIEDLLHPMDPTANLHP
jgi:hypothetical protein